MSLDDFISLSEFLLGVPFQPPLPPLTSLDPDLANVYYNQLTGTNQALMQSLLTTWTTILKMPASQRTVAVNSQIMGDAKLGPLARQIILAWYTGFHPYYPGNGPQPNPANYEQTLVWMLAQAHPMGVPLSFGYWQYKPQGN